MIAVCRIDGAGLAVTSTRRVPLPCPDDGSIFATHAASAAAVHAHSGVVVSTTCSLPPDELTAAAGAARVRAHLTGVGSVVVTDVDPHAASSALLMTTSATRSDHGVNRAVTFSRTMRIVMIRGFDRVLLSSLHDFELDAVRRRHERRAEQPVHRRPRPLPHGDAFGFESRKGPVEPLDAERDVIEHAPAGGGER